MMELFHALAAFTARPPLRSQCMRAIKSNEWTSCVDPPLSVAMQDEDAKMVALADCACDIIACINIQWWRLTTVINEEQEYVMLSMIVGRERVSHE